MKNFSNEVFRPNNSNIRNAVKTYLSGNPNNLPPIGKWDTSGVSEMGRLFRGKSTFNEDINDWDVSNVENMSDMFFGATSFNQPLNKWDTSNVEDMYMMFYGTPFNQDISMWNVSNVTSMGGMFCNTPFNSPLNNWDVSNVVDMSRMFTASLFNQPINNWNISNVLYFNSMFFSAERFNQPLDNWNVSNAVNLVSMFNDATAFDQDISNWVINPNADTQLIFQDMNLREDFKPPVLRRRIEPRPLAIPNQGIAFQVHKAFEQIVFSKLFELLTNNVIDTYSESIPFNEYVVNTLQDILNAYSEPDKEELQRKFTEMLPKIREINYNVDFKMTPNPDGKDAFFTILKFVQNQEKRYQDSYISFFINDSYNAYDSDKDSISCTKGIKERLIFALGQAGYDINNPLYTQISEVIYPLKDQQIYIFIGNCIKKNKNELLSLEDKSLENKKEIIKTCVKNHFIENFPEMDINRLENKIVELINTPDIIELLSDESLKLTGGKRKSMSKTKKKSKIKRTTKRAKKYSRKRKTRKCKR